MAANHGSVAATCRAHRNGEKQQQAAAQQCEMAAATAASAAKHASGMRKISTSAWRIIEMAAANQANRRHRRINGSGMANGMAAA